MIPLSIPLLIRSSTPVDRMEVEVNRGIVPVKVVVVAVVVVAVAMAMMEM